MPYPKKIRIDFPIGVRRKFYHRRRTKLVSAKCGITTSIAVRPPITPNESMLFRYPNFHPQTRRRIDACIAKPLLQISFFDDSVHTGVSSYLTFFFFRIAKSRLIFFFFAKWNRVGRFSLELEKKNCEECEKTIFFFRFFFAIGYFERRMNPVQIRKSFYDHYN
jgi:hypothetical protein